MNRGLEKNKTSHGYSLITLFIFVTALVSFSKNEASSAATLEIIKPSEEQRIVLPDVSVKAKVTPSSDLKGDIKWKTVVEEEYSTSTGSDVEGKINVTFPFNNNSFGPNVVTAVIETVETDEGGGIDTDDHDFCTIDSYDPATGRITHIQDPNCSVPVVVPRDPNDKVGPAGFGEQRFTAAGQIMVNTINFENVATATAPAHEVAVTDQLDAKFDWRTFRLREIAFGKTVVTVPDNRSFYQTRLTLENGMLLDIDAGIDIRTGKAHWNFTTIDPSTGQSPNDPALGFLPPNDADHNGEGHVIFSIKSKVGSLTGDRVTNEATIVFDTNEPIDTNEILNTIDGAAPSSSVSALPARTQENTFAVFWTGEDDAGGSGLAGYDIYVSDNDKAYELWLEKTTETSRVFTGQTGHTYKFYSRAYDNAGNLEAAPTEPDAVTSIISHIPRDPNPSDGAADVAVNTVLTWASGDAADVIDLYFWKGEEQKPATPLAAGLTTGTYTPSATLLYNTVYHWQLTARGSFGEAAGPVWSFTTIADTIPPDAPVVSGTTPTNNTKPTWTWLSGGNGGNGAYQCQLDGGTWGGCTSPYTPASALSEGAHSLNVQERDDAGNWSVSGSKAIVIDVTAPSLSVSVFADSQSTNSTDITVCSRDVVIKGEATDQLLITASVTHGLDVFKPAVAEGRFEQAVAFTKDGLNTVTVSVTDEAGNTATAQRNITCIAKGDPDNQDGMTIADALKVARRVAELSVTEPFCMTAADVNCDEDVNIIDALFIARKAAGLSVPNWCGK